MAKDIIGDDVGESPQTRPYNPVEETVKNQISFDKTATALGKLIIISYLAIIIISFLLKVFGLCVDCYPTFLEKFETLVLIITGFFFGTRLVNQYIPIQKNK